MNEELDNRNSFQVTLMFLGTPRSGAFVLDRPSFDSFQLLISITLGAKGDFEKKG